MTKLKIVRSHNTSKWTFHKDGTVSFFNSLTGEWERGDTKPYLAAVRAARAAAKFITSTQG